MNLSEKIESHDAVVGIIALGYVGLPLAVAFAEAGFQVVGIFQDPTKSMNNIAIRVENLGKAFQRSNVLTF